MSKFGWDLPPGCTQKHIDEAFGSSDPSKLQDDVFNILDGYISSKYINDIMDLIEAGEAEMQAAGAAAEAEAYADQLRDEKLLSDGLED